MNLAARFSTSANIGELDLRLTRRSLILGNLALLQVQALIVSLISGLLAFILGLLSRRGVHHALQNPVYNPNNGGVSESLRGGYFEALLVLCVSMLAASISSGVLGSFMCSLVVMCRRFKINPGESRLGALARPAADDMCSPRQHCNTTGLGAGRHGHPRHPRCAVEHLCQIHGSVARVKSCELLLTTRFLAGTLVSTAVFLLLLGAVGVNVVITFRNAYVQELLTIGWGPLFIAMAISRCVRLLRAPIEPPLTHPTSRSGSGLVLEAYVNEYEGFGLFAPVVTAISGAAGSIYVSRISTSLHSSSKEHYLIVALSLFALTCPVLFLFFLFVWATGQAPVTLLFAVGFVVVVCLQVSSRTSPFDLDRDLTSSRFPGRPLPHPSISPSVHPMAHGLRPGWYAHLSPLRMRRMLTRPFTPPAVYALPLLSSFLDVSGQLLLVGAFALGKKAVAAVAGVNEGVVEVGADALGLR